MTAEPRAAFRRILVALDASSESLAALETAAQMAKRLEAELTGLFVEDADLFKLVGYPFVREMNLATRTGRSLDLATVERELGAQAALARRALEHAAQQRRVPWSFRVIRGAVETELLAAALEADLVAVGKAFHPLTGSARLGRMAQALSLRASCSLLLGVPGLRQSEAVGVAYDGSPVAGDALDTAARIANDDGGQLLVLLIAETGDVAAEHEAAVRRRLRGSPLALAFRRIVGASWAAMLPLIELERPRLMVVGVDPQSRAREAIGRLAESAGVPVLLVRRAATAA